MATVENDRLDNNVLFFYELPQIVISHTESTPLRVTISTDSSGTILDEAYWADFNQKIYLDIKDLVASELSHDIPELGEFTQQKAIYNIFYLSIEGAAPIVFSVNGFSSDAALKLSDADIVRIPEDYLLPLSLFNNASEYSIEYIFSDGSTANGGIVAAQNSGVGVVAGIIPLAQSPAAGKKRFQIKAVSEKSTLYSPVYEITGGNFEQYLFANRYGGFDNIAMDGALSFVPNMSFEAASYSGHNEQVASESEYKYTQNSGYLSSTVIDLMSELLCSSQIYHLDKNGIFRRIIILESDLSSKSNEHLHSFTFQYKYVDDVRPRSLKGKTPVDARSSSGGAVNTLMYKLTESPMEIRHNKNRFPSVTVIDKQNQIVTVEVEYLDSNRIQVSWNGELSGYAYIN